MKKLLLSLCALLPLLGASQVKVLDQPPEPAQKVIPYDSLSNVPGYNFAGFIGQELFLPPLSEKECERGYTLIHPNGGSALDNVPCEEIAGHTFRVADIIKQTIYDATFALVDNETAKVYTYHYTRFDKSWQFITLGYKVKYEQRYAGKKFIDLSGICEKDTNTGEYVFGKRGSVWEFKEIVAMADYHPLRYIYTNGEGNTIACSKTEDMMLKSEIDNLAAKYGRRMCDLAVQGKIKVGMPADLVRIAKGDPRTINYASYGEQWVYGEYGNDCVYLKNGKVTSWN